jgi:hypothetical protein
MSESAVSGSAFPQVSSALQPQQERLPVGMAVLTIVGASGLLWIGIYAGVSFLIGL